MRSVRYASVCYCVLKQVLKQLYACQCQQTIVDIAAQPGPPTCSAAHTNTHTRTHSCNKNTPRKGILHKLEARVLGNQHEASGQVDQPRVLGGYVERGPWGEGVVPTPLVLRDEERPSEAQDTGKGALPEDVCEEHGDDGGGKVIWVAVDVRTLRTRHRGQGRNGGAATGGCA